MQCTFSLVTAVIIARCQEKMAELMLSPANCEIRAVIRFLHAQNHSPAEIHRQLCHVYGPKSMRDGMARKWCGHDERRSGRPSLVTPELMESEWQAVLQNRRFTISELSGHDMQTAVTSWFQTLTVDSYDVGIRMLAHGCFNNGGDYVEKKPVNLCK